MRMQTNTFPVYTYGELSDEAKSKVQSWWSADLDYDCIYEDAATIADLFGLDIRRTRKTLMNGGHRYDPTIYWSGFWSQGDGASFEGTYKYKKGALKAVKAYCGDAEVHRIVNGLQDVQRRHFYKLTARMGRGAGSNFYSHSNTCLLYTSDAADDLLCVDLGGRRIIKKKIELMNLPTYNTAASPLLHSLLTYPQFL